MTKRKLNSTNGGRGTTKDVVLGAVERGGKVIVQLVENVKAETITKFIKKFVDTDKTEFYTDQFRAYNDVGEIMQKHETMNRSKQWEPDGIHTNTIEGFWSFVKRAWYGTHHHYSTGYTPLYLQIRAINTTIEEKRIYLLSFLQRVWNKVILNPLKSKTTYAVLKIYLNNCGV